MLIVKRCLKHGALSIEDLIKSGSTHGKQRFKCKKCMKEIHAKNYIKNKEILSKKHALYRKNNVIKVRNIKRKSRIKNLEPAKKINAIRRVNNAYYPDFYPDDNYIKHLLNKHRKNLSQSDISHELITLKRATLLLKRKIRQIKDKQIFDNHGAKLNDENRKCK